MYHFPCATASGAFQDLMTLYVYCTNHLGEAAMCSEGKLFRIILYLWKIFGNIWKNLKKKKL